MNSDIIQNFKQAHANAREAVAADSSLPKISATVLLSFLADMFRNDEKGRLDVAKEYGKKYGPVFLNYGKLLSEEFFTNVIHDFLKNSDREEFRAMADNDVAKCLVSSSEKVLVIMTAYFKKQITEEEFLIQMSKTGIGEVGTKVMDAFGINTEELTSNPVTILKFTGPFLAYQGAMGAYREYSKAMEELQLARANRQRIEEECQKSIELIRTYREQAEQRVSEYMNEHLDAFENGFAAMDQAILANDPDGYIAGNVQIQQILGANIQFTNFEEFDDLMTSDDDFIF